MNEIVSTWVLRAAPLPVAGVAATGTARMALAARVRQSGRSVRGCFGPDVLVVIDPEPPWVDGGVWLGRDPDAPGCLWPTTTRPSAPPDLVLSALTRGRGDGPWAAWPGHVVSLRHAAPLTGDVIARIVG